MYTHLPPEIKTNICQHLFWNKEGRNKFKLLCSNSNEVFKNEIEQKKKELAKFKPFDLFEKCIKNEELALFCLKYMPSKFGGYDARAMNLFYGLRAGPYGANRYESPSYLYISGHYFLKLAMRFMSCREYILDNLNERISQKTLKFLESKNGYYRLYGPYCHV